MNSLYLTFETSLEDDDGTVRQIPLLPGGADMEVTGKNRGKFVDLSIQTKFVTAIRESIQEVRLGFLELTDHQETLVEVSGLGRNYF